MRCSKHKSAAGDVAVSPLKKSELPAAKPEVVPITEADGDSRDHNSVKDPEVVPGVTEPAANGSEGSAKDPPQSQVVQGIEAAARGSDGVEEAKEVKDADKNPGPADQKAPAAEKKETKEESQVGKLISRESPDQYFSSRKEEEKIHGIAGEGGGFFSPGFEPGHGGKKTEDNGQVSQVLPKAVEEGPKEKLELPELETETNAAASKEVDDAGKINEEADAKKEHTLTDDTAKEKEIQAEAAAAAAAEDHQTTNVEGEAPHGTLQSK
ncbi:hypothetical protein H6P81_004303 [Aristolochia fimbriata]|uniref:Uncharacterized protein n=1 Tax=Aristolochia fimbriata TaxID=158543 RepID=A0AAV7FF13_ARIFI|nr:hypothetical protein H6P81_004303 [Aristolochia fimbriata]